jgi:hypothetical protein
VQCSAVERLHLQPACGGMRSLIGYSTYLEGQPARGPGEGDMWVNGRVFEVRETYLVFGCSFDSL